MGKLSNYLERVYSEKMEGGIAPAGSSKEFSSGKGAAGNDTIEIEINGESVIIVHNGKSSQMPLEQFKQQPLYKTLIGNDQELERYKPGINPPQDFLIVNGKVVKKNPEK